MFSNDKSRILFGRLSTMSGIGFLLFAFLLGAAPVSAQQESVVLIHTEVGSGYGVAWGKPGNIVTALHVVAGRSKIFVKWKNQESPATVERIYKPADLALLRLQTPLTIPRLEVYSGDAPMDTPLDFWEAPVKMLRMNKKETRLDKSIPLEQLDNRLEKNAVSFAKALCSDGQSNYPALKTNVFKFEEKNIRKAHSGSPLTLDNQIVAMIDGGPATNAKGSVWAIPAADNFAKLLNAGPSENPRQACSSERLYSGIRADNPHLDPKLAGLANDLAASEASPFKFQDDSGDQLSFRLEYRAPFEDIYETMFEEDQEYTRDLLQDEDHSTDGKVSLRDLFNQSLDLFQDDETGATIAIPTKSKMSVERNDGHSVIRVSSPQAGTTMIISVQHTNSIKESKAARDWFSQYMVRDGRRWVVETKENGEANGDDVEDFLSDRHEPYYNALMERVVYGSDGESVVADLYASLTIDENDFLGVAIIANNWDKLTKKERTFNYLMEACVILTDFAYF